MANKRPEITDEEIGMRAFKLRKAKAVERALEKLRRGLHDSWSLFSQKDLNDLGWIIGELWAYETRADWEDLHFSKLTAEDVLELISISRDLQESPHQVAETMERAIEIVRARSV